MNHAKMPDFQNLDEDAFWLALQDSNWLIPTEKVVRAFEELGTLKGLWECSYRYLHSLDLDDRSIKKFCEYANFLKVDKLQRDLGYLSKNRMRMIRYVDEDYPSALRTDVDNPPLLLFQKGALLDFENCVAMAGTRDCSMHGRLMARRLAKSIAAKGYTIVSGLARGTDEWAHSGALETPKGKTIAVLPWITPLYPPEHSKLLEEIQNRGAAISERLEKPVDRSAKGKFVQRNRITSGVSRCVIALESEEEGGTVHQVRIAISQRRKVFAVKPRSNDKFKKGFKLFVDMGAVPVDSSREILDYLSKEAPITTTEKKLDFFYQHTLNVSKGSDL